MAKATQPRKRRKGATNRKAGSKNAATSLGFEAGDGASMLAWVLEQTRAEVVADARRSADLQFAIQFAKFMGKAFEVSLDDLFPGVVSGEKPSRAARGLKRVDVMYSTREAGLELALSFKSVHFGEVERSAKFTHNMKRNDEELRVEATGHHLRQPYAVLGAVIFLPFESCDDAPETSSFAKWVEYLWPLRGRKSPEDPPDRFELVFVSLYDRDGSELGFYEVGGAAPCPRRGRPQLLTFAELCTRLRNLYEERNGLDFRFAD